MKNKPCVLKTFAVLILGCAMTISLSLTTMDSAVTHNELRESNSFNCLPKVAPALPSESFGMVSYSHAAADPLEMLFRIMFILFFISPPIIALLLFLIWRELRSRNKMK